MRRIRKPDVARMCCYINYTSCLSVILSTSNLQNSLSRLFILHQLIPQFISRPLSAISQSLLSVSVVSSTNTFFGQRAFCVAASTVFNALPQDIRFTDNISTFRRLPQCFISAMHIAISTCTSYSTYFVDTARITE